MLVSSHECGSDAGCERLSIDGRVIHVWRGRPVEGDLATHVLLHPPGHGGVGTRCGHLAPIEAPDAYAEAILHWLADCGLH